MMWYWGNSGVHWWGWFIGFLLTIGFWAIVIYIFLNLMRSFAAKGHDHPSPAHEDPERALARRFANGEIDEDEFHRRLEVLRSHGLSGKS